VISQKTFLSKQSVIDCYSTVVVCTGCDSGSLTEIGVVLCPALCMFEHIESTD
jgi:hypothetical protein